MQECANRALVLQAMEIDHAVERDVLVWRVLVPEHEEARAREQLQLYEAENQAARSTIKHTPPQPGAVIGAVIWAYVLLTVFALQGRYGFGFDWVAAGRIDVAAIRGGEWWRAVTALTLHADAAHLFVNIGMGAVFGGLLAREVGVGLAWLLILIGGTVGNLMNVLVQRPWHTAIGASTAVFAALGLLAAYLWTGKRLIRDSWARRWAPVVGAVLLLAWLGTGGERTDIVAHLTGFLAGFGMGVVLGRVAQQGTAKPMRQWLLGGVSLLSVMLAWKFAL
jgi:membrane associated rhomboid family serine protease